MFPRVVSLFSASIFVFVDCLFIKRLHFLFFSKEVILRVLWRVMCGEPAARLHKSSVV